MLSDTPPAVINAAKKVLQIPGQATNFNVLFQLGYAYMRNDEYELASTYFMDAHHINSEHVALKTAMAELRRKVMSGQWRKRRHDEL